LRYNRVATVPKEFDFSQHNTLISLSPYTTLGGVLFMVTGEQKLLAIAAHLTYFLGGLGFVLAPLVIFLIKRDDPFVADHAKQALVAHLVMLVAGMVTGILSMLLIGLLLIPVLALLAIALFITSILASLKALNGEYYRYPLIQGLVEKI
jgi:uncharacterized Tic20 family protein